MQETPIVTQRIMVKWYNEIKNKIDTKSQAILWRFSNDIKDNFLTYGIYAIPERYRFIQHKAISKEYINGELKYKLTLFTVDNIIGTSGDFSERILSFCDKGKIYQTELKETYYNFDDVMYQIMTDDYIQRNLDIFFNKQYRKLVNSVDLIGDMA